MRTIVEDDKVLFCANDVAQALGYSNLHDALIKYCKHSTLITGVANRDPDNKVSFRARKYIPEGDVYRLIVSSKLPGAEKFKISCPAHLRFREKKRCESAIPVIFPPIGQKSYVYKA